MKKITLLLLTVLALLGAGNAQPYFIGDITFVGNQAIFTVKPVGGNITNKIAVLEFYVRWPQSEGNAISFDNFIPNNSAFPGLFITDARNDAADDGYNNHHFAFIGMTSAVRTYTDGVTYEVFRTTMSGTLPAFFQLVANNTQVDPYYFTVVGEYATDYTPYSTDPFNGGSNGGGDFYYKTFALSTLPIHLQSFSGSVNGCSATLNWVTSSEVNGSRFEIQLSNNGRDFKTVAEVPVAASNGGDHSYTKTLPLSYLASYYRLKMISTDDAPKYSNIILLTASECAAFKPLVVQVMPNPVREHNLHLSVSSANDDDFDVVIVDMGGKQLSKFSAHVLKGVNDVSYKLPMAAQGQYLLNLTSRSGVTLTQKLLVE